MEAKAVKPRDGRRVEWVIQVDVEITRNNDNSGKKGKGA